MSRIHLPQSIDRRDALLERLYHNVPTWLFLGLIICLIACASDPVAAESNTARSPRKAALLSLLLPGAGERYAGGRRSSRFFFFTEASFWSGTVLFRGLESDREDAFKSFAATHAGVKTEGKSNAFFDDMVLFRSIYDRNTRARFLDGELANLRPETVPNLWEWDSDASRFEFQRLRSKANSAGQKAFLFVGALVFNRFASALNAARIARRTLVQEGPARMEWHAFAHPEGGLGVRLRAGF